MIGRLWVVLGEHLIGTEVYMYLNEAHHEVEFIQGIPGYKELLYLLRRCYIYFLNNIMTYANYRSWRET